MEVYMEFVKKSFQQRYIYRMNSYIQIFGTLLRLFITISAWTALFNGHASINGITLTDMVSFVTINLIVDSLTYSRIGERIADRVNDGSIAVDFIKPINFKYYMFSEELGENLYRAMFTAIPACIFAILLWGLRIPDSGLNFLLFMISILNGIVLIYHINYVLGLLAFWFHTSLYVTWFLGAFFELFSGTFVPLWFYPDFLYRISLFLPFRLIAFEPISIYLGKQSLSSSLNVILIQIIWILALRLLEMFIWKRAQDKITVHGG